MNNTGGPAFPSHKSINGVIYDGMTLRDYFAAKAMQGWLSTWENEDSTKLAEFCYRVADAMLVERTKGKK